MSEDHKANTLEMIAVMQAYVDGKPIEHSYPRDDQWVLMPEPSWNWGSNKYRIATIPDSINWDHVSAEWKYMARNASGNPVLFTHEPNIRLNVWATEERCLTAQPFASYVQGTVDWTCSLVKRPD